MLNINEEDKKYLVGSDRQRLNVIVYFLNAEHPEDFFDRGIDGMITLLKEAKEQCEREELSLEIDYEDNRWDESRDYVTIKGVRIENDDEYNKRLLTSIEARKANEKTQLETQKRVEKNKIEQARKLLENTGFTVEKKKK